MGIKSQRRRDTFLDGLTHGLMQSDEGFVLGIAVFALAAIFMLPKTVFRLSRLAWHTETKQGRSGHHRRIVLSLVWYVFFWLLAFGVLGGLVWLALNTNFFG
jgi:hypothetical protein